jgi:hypothetical protein
MMVAAAWLGVAATAGTALALPSFGTGPYEIDFHDRTVVIGTTVGPAGSSITSYDGDPGPGVTTVFLRQPGVVLPGDELRSWAVATLVAPGTVPGLIWPSTGAFPFEVTTLVQGLVADPNSPAFTNSAFCSLGGVLGAHTCDIWWNAGANGATMEAFIDTVPGASLFKRTGTPVLTTLPGVTDTPFRIDTGAADGTPLFSGSFIHVIPTGTVTCTILGACTSPSAPVLLVTAPTSEGLTFFASGGASNGTSGAEAGTNGIVDVDQGAGGILGPSIANGIPGIDGVGTQDISFNAQVFFADKTTTGIHQGADTVCVGTEAIAGDTTSCGGAATVSSDSKDPLLFIVLAPNPSALLLMGSGLFGIGMFARRSRRK